MSQLDPLLGQTLGGRFTIVRLIARGGMGAVYRAVQPGEPRKVAIKVLHPETSGDATMLARFEREADAMMRLSHPNAVKVIERGTDGPTSYLVMELVEGQSLKERLAARGKLSPSEAVDLITPVCEALAATHEAGLIHRDLKPENIMITDDPRSPGNEVPKILDFGLAKPLDDQPGQQLTALGSVVGTPAYMAPEQVSARPVTIATDIYALGVLLYELVTGRLPFDSEDPLRIVWLHLHGEIDPPSKLVPDLPPALERAILKALSRQPEGRHQSALDLRDDLRASLTTIPVPVLPNAIPGAVRVKVNAEADESGETLPARGPGQPLPSSVRPRHVVIPSGSAAGEALATTLSVDSPPVALPQPKAASPVVVSPAAPAPKADLAPPAPPPKKSIFLRSPVLSIAAGIALAFGLAALALPLLLH
ncbi:MAG: serine/threonine-protein kinase [Byssovorax sp.]